MAQVKKRLDDIAKPLCGLGALENLLIRIAGLTGTKKIGCDPAAVLVFCADHGVVAEGVTQTSSQVTAQMAAAMAAGKSCVCQMATREGVRVIPLDVGMLTPVRGVESLAIRRGTGDLAREPAMTREEAVSMILTGMDLALRYREAGYRLLLSGEMGIGNTTPASAMAAVLLDRPVEEMTGPGAGLSREGVIHKQAVIHQAIALHRPDADDPLGVLAALGGLEIAAMTGLFLGGALYQIPVIMDGWISSVAALTAMRLSPRSVQAILPSHCSEEPGARAVIQALGLSPLITAGLHLGEGTGAICLVPLLRMALSVYENGSSFSDLQLVPYEPL